MFNTTTTSPYVNNILNDIVLSIGAVLEVYQYYRGLKVRNDIWQKPKVRNSFARSPTVWQKVKR
jgi:hypothetical protein